MWQFTGDSTQVFTQYLDNATGGPLTAEPGGVYDMRPVAGLPLPVPPDTGNWVAPLGSPGPGPADPPAAPVASPLAAVIDASPPATPKAAAKATPTPAAAADDSTPADPPA